MKSCGRKNLRAEREIYFFKKVAISKLYNFDSSIRLKKSMSQNLWQIGRPDPNAFFNVFFFFFFFFSEQQACKIWVGHNLVQYEIWNLIFGWIRHKTEHKVEEVCCSEVFYFVCHVFSCIFWQASS